MAEYLTIYDSEGRDTGFVEKRDGRVFPGAYYLVVHVFTRDGAGNLLATRRSPDKPFFPDRWEITGGCVLAGEESREGARRELEEETGLRPQSLTKLGRIVCPTFEGGAYFLMDVFEARVEGTAPSLTMQQGEVSSWRWLRPGELDRLVENEPAEPLTPLCWARFKEYFLNTDNHKEDKHE